ncbi:MAG: YDG domain-containing protein [Lachnospiraceae bacterium]|nr:YDG domain-containing protein [Lachnospiraceae bacterium]
MRENKKRFRKCLSLVLTLCLIVGMIPDTVFAQDDANAVAVEAGTEATVGENEGVAAEVGENEGVTAAAGETENGAEAAEDEAGTETEETETETESVTETTLTEAVTEAAETETAAGAAQTESSEESGTEAETGTETEAVTETTVTGEESETEAVQAESAETAAESGTEDETESETTAVLLGSSASALCDHGNDASTCAVCEVEAQIAALPGVDEIAEMDTDGQNEVYALASDICDVYYALSEEDQELVSNIDMLWEILDYFSGAISLAETAVAQVGETTYSTIADAIDDAAESEDTVTLLDDVTENVTISSGISITLDLAGHTLTGTGSGSVITINSGTLTLKDSSTGQTGTVTGGSATYGGGVYVSGGTFNMVGGTISGNTAKSYGGGVYVQGSSTFTMTGGTISNNSLTGYNCSGGGVYVYSANATFNMKGGTISGNGADSGSSGNSGNGGGVAVWYCTFVMMGGEISNNTTNGQGGGVRVLSGSFTMSGGTISGNTATICGGGVYLYGGSFTMSGGTITSNTVTNTYTYSGNQGSGVYLGTGTFSVSGSPVISGNTKNGDEQNVFLPNSNYITLAGELSEGASIGVTTDTKPTGSTAVEITAAEGETAYYSGAAGYFFSDDTAYGVQTNSDGAYLELYCLTPLTEDDFEVNTDSETYTGSEITKSITSTSGLTEGTDYTVTYSDNVNKGTATITIEGMGEYTGTLTYHFTINPITVTAAVSASNKEYNGTTNATVTATVSEDDLIGKDSITISGLAGTFADANVGTGKTVTVDTTEAVVTGNDNGNYSISYTTDNVTADIMAKTVTATVNASDKVYDGTADATVTATLTTAEGLIDGDSITISNLTGTFEDANVGTSKVVTVNTESAAVTGNDKGNYSISYATENVTASITVKSVMAAVSAEDKVYDGTTDATVTATLTAAEGLAEGDSITITGLTGAFADANVGTGKTVTVVTTGATVTGNDKGNYNISYETEGVTADITAKAITVTITPGGGTYGGTITPASAVLNGLVSTDESSSGEGSSDADSVQVTLTYTGTAYDGTVYNGTTVPTQAGTYTVTASISDTNYTLTGTTTAEFVVAKATYDMSSVSFEDTTCTYDGSEKALKISGTLPDGVSVSYTNNTLMNVGSTEATASFTGDANNYEAIASMTATLTITNADLTVTVTGYEGVYDGGEHSITVEADDGATVTYCYTEDTEDEEYSDDLGADGEEETADDKEYTETNPAFTDAGTYTVYYKVSKANYNEVAGSARVIITQRAVTVTIDSKNSTYGNEIVELTAEVTNGSIVEGDEGIYSLATEAASLSDVGSYDITGTAQNDNYSITFVNGEGAYTITAAELTDVAVAQSGTLVYDGTALTAAVTTSAEAVDDSEVTFTYSTSADGDGTYTSVVPAFTNAGSYMVYYRAEAANHETVEGSFTVTIEKATYDMRGVSFEDVTCTYDGAEKTLTITGDENLPDGVSVSYTDNTLTNVGSTVATAAFTGDADNYETIASMTATLTITAAELSNVTVSQSGTLTYDGTAQTAEVTASAETVDGTDDAVAFTYSTSEEGEYSETVPAFT